jgi:hypothetical protein
MAPVALATRPSLSLRHRRGRSVAGMAAAVAAHPLPEWPLPSPPISGVAAAAARRRHGGERQVEDWGRDAEGIGHGG